MWSKHAVCLLTLLGLLPAFVLAAGQPADPLAPFFEKTGDAGVPVAAWLARDGAARVDVYSFGKVTRFAFDRDGKSTSSASPAAYDTKVLDGLKFTAAGASRQAAARNYPDGAEIRAVALRAGKSGMFFAAAAYDRNAKFLGTHLFSADTGQWQGWVDGIGEPDPLESK
jgi:hypothetical protein